MLCFQMSVNILEYLNIENVASITEKLKAIYVCGISIHIFYNKNNFVASSAEKLAIKVHKNSSVDNDQ